MANRRVQPSDEDAELTVRATISFPESHYAELEKIAHSQRVSLAWVVREAVGSYLQNKWPLLETSETQANQLEIKK